MAMPAQWRIMGGLLAGALLVGTGVGVALGDDDAVAEVRSAATEHRAPSGAPSGVNEYGETYGSSADAATPYDEPDLILVVTNEGPEAYVKREELNGPTPASPEEAAAMSRSATERTITAYAKDGRTVVGTFTIGG